MAAPPGLLELEREPGPVQPPVEGIQPGAPAGAAAGRAAFRGHSERLGQRGERRGREILSGFVPGGRLPDEFPQARHYHLKLSFGAMLSLAPVNLLFTLPGRWT